MPTELPGAWRLLIEAPEWLADPAANVAVDAVLTESVGAGAAPPTLRIWENSPCLVVGWGEHRLPNIPAGAALAAAHGLRLLRRHSGGQAVLHGPGYVNFSAVMALDPAHNLSEDYRRLLEPFMAGLRARGVAAELGAVEGAYCVGRYDLACRGRKLAGTAQARRRGGVLVHGTLPVDADLPQLARVITEFYAAAGVQRPVDPRTLTSVAQETGRPVSAGEAERALLEGWRARADLVRGRLLPAERARIRELAAELAL